VSDAAARRVPDIDKNTERILTMFVLPARSNASVTKLLKLADFHSVFSSSVSSANMTAEVT